MVLLKEETLKSWLESINRNQSWLAKKLHKTKGYISQIKHNRCKIPLIMIEKLLIVTNMRFEDLFYFNGRDDPREFFMNDIYFKGEENFYKGKEYGKKIKKIEEKT